MPDLYNEFLNSYPEYKEDVEKHVTNYVGRKAKVSTLKDDSILYDTSRNAWKKEGNKIVCENYKSCFLPFNAKMAKTEIFITDNMTYVVNKNSIVTDKTIFVD